MSASVAEYQEDAARAVRFAGHVRRAERHRAPDAGGRRRRRRQDRRQSPGRQSDRDRPQARSRSRADRRVRCGSAILAVSTRRRDSWCSARAVRAIPRDVPFELQIRGPQLDDAARRFVDELKTTIGDDPRVRFEPAVPAGDVPRVLADLDVLLCPSITFENGPTVALEAMAVGTPVIASRVGNLAEIIDDGVNGRLVPAGDVGALAAALTEAADAPSATIDLWRRALPESADHGRHRARLPRAVRRMTSPRNTRRPARDGGDLRAPVDLSPHVEKRRRVRGRRLRRPRGRHLPRTVGGGNRPRRAVATRLARRGDRLSPRRSAADLLAHRRALPRGAHGRGALEAPLAHRSASSLVRSVAFIRSSSARPRRRLPIFCTAARPVRWRRSPRRHAGCRFRTGSISKTGTAANRAGPMLRSTTRSPRAWRRRSYATRRLPRPPANRLPRRTAISTASSRPWCTTPFRLPSEPPDFSRRDPSTLRLYWFSQTIGPGRGLEEAVVAAGLRRDRRRARASRPRAATAISRRCARSRRRTRRGSSVVHHAPASPDAMIDRGPRLRRRAGAGTDGGPQPPAVPDEQGVHLHSGRCGRGDERYARTARARRRSRPRRGAGRAWRRRRAGVGARTLGGRSRRARLRQAHRLAARRSADGTGSTTPSAARCTASRSRRSHEDPARDGSVHQGAAAITTAASSAWSPISPTA